jgi:hypothetical protein
MFPLLGYAFLSVCPEYTFADSIWEADMTGRVRERGGIAGTRQRPARTALALAIAFISLVVATQSLHAQTFSVLYTFTGKYCGDRQVVEIMRHEWLRREIEKPLQDVVGTKFFP